MTNQLNVIYDIKFETNIVEYGNKRYFTRKYYVNIDLIFRNKNETIFNITLEKI